MDEYTFRVADVLDGKFIDLTSLVNYHLSLFQGLIERKNVARLKAILALDEVDAEILMNIRSIETIGFYAATASLSSNG